MSAVTFTATATVGEIWSTAVAEATHVAGHTINVLNGDGQSPIQVNPANPLVLLIIQLVLILALSRILAFFFGRFRVPRVVCEIVAGILLGPTAFGQIPGFTENIFPEASITYLNLISNLGLVLFLFVIGTDVDFSLLRRNLKPTLAVSAAGLVIPFGLGCAVSVGLYQEFSPKSVVFTTFMCFIGTSSSITAFPVLSRILGDLHLFQDPVGLVVLASGVVNDVLGWCLLALSIALATAGTGVVVVYIILSLVGWWLFLYFLCRPALNWLARKTGSFSRPDGPTQGYVCAVLALVLVSAWFSQIIGISEIFGGFLVGLIIPRSLGHHFAAKIEDLVICIFLPLYFATSGLNTNLTLLNRGIIWGWTVCVMVVAFLGKFVGSAVAARLTGFTWRQAGAAGSLMSAKGLIELIVLNQGLQVGIITQTIFSIFVLEAVVLTIAATPLTLAFYPSHLRLSSREALSAPPTSDSKDGSALDKSPFGALAQPRTRFAIVLDQLEALGGAMVLTHLLAASGARREPAPQPTPAPTAHGTVTSDAALLTATSTTAVPTPRAGTPAPPARVQAPLTLTPLRLIELTERTSGVMLASEEAASHLARDPLVALYRTFASLVGGGRVALERGEFAMTGLENWAETVARLGGAKGEAEQPGVVESFIPNPFEALFGNPSSGPSASSAAASSGSTAGAPLFAAFLRDVFLDSSCDVGVLLDRSSPSSLAPTPAGAPTHLFVPFFGGADDRACLALAAQLVRRGGGALSAKVLVLERAAEPTEADRASAGADEGDALDVGPTTTGGEGSSAAPLHPHSPHLAHLHLPLHHTPGLTTRAGETNYGSSAAHAQGLASETADDVALSAAEALGASLPDGVLRIERTQTAFPLRAMRSALSALPAPPLVLVGRSRVDAPSHRAESAALLARAPARGGVCASAEVRRAVGEAATALLLAGGAEYVLVVQSERTAGRRREKRMAAALGREKDKEDAS
ncbi:K(+)/H(+) antiporter [Rhodotorula kratochvilovae]